MRSGGWKKSKKSITVEGGKKIKMNKHVSTFIREMRERILDFKRSKFTFTGKSLSEALIFASTNPQNDNRLFIEL